MIFIAVWTTVFAVLAAYLLHSPKVRSWLAVTIHAKILRRVAICSIAIVVSIVVAYKTHPQQEATQTNDLRIFEEYSANAVLKLDSMGRMSVDSSCNLDHSKPELAYVMPIILNTYVEIVEKPTKPILVRIDDTLQIQMRGYKQFKNRGIRLTKLLQKKLGNRYDIKIFSNETVHTLQVVYIGTPWDKEQLMALPIMEAAQKNHVDPALLMSLIRHVSNFDFDFKGPKDTYGLLAMGGHSEADHKAGGKHSEESCNLDGLSQVFVGAERLGKQLQVLSRENAIATFYPERGMEYPDANWTKSPLIKSWVNQVLDDVEFYRNNGLKPLE